MGAGVVVVGEVCVCVGGGGGSGIVLGVLIADYS